MKVWGYLLCLGSALVLTGCPAPSGPPSTSTSTAVPTATPRPAKDLVLLAAQFPLPGYAVTTDVQVDTQPGQGWETFWVWVCKVSVMGHILGLK